MQKGKAKGKDIKSVVKNAFKYGDCQLGSSNTSLGNLSSLYDYTPSDLPEIFEEVRKSHRKHQAKKEGGSKRFDLNLGKNKQIQGATILVTKKYLSSPSKICPS